MSAQGVPNVDEKRAPSPSTPPQKVKEDSGDAAVPVDSEKKTTRPERNATFKDYLVSLPLIATDVQIAIFQTKVRPTD